MTQQSVFLYSTLYAYKNQKFHSSFASYRLLQVSSNASSLDTVRVTDNVVPSFQIFRQRLPLKNQLQSYVIGRPEQSSWQLHGDNFVLYNWCPVL